MSATSLDVSCSNRTFSGTIYIECTHTLSVDYCTGIQRVVNSILHYSQDVEEKFGMKIRPIVLDEFGFCEPQHSTMPRFNKQLSRCSKETAFRFLSSRFRFLADFVRLSSKLSAVEKILPEMILRLGLRTKVEKTFLSLSDRLWQLGFQRVRFSENDVLLLLDSSWTLPIIDSIWEAKSSNCRVGCVVYDIIPVSHPQFCDDNIVSCFTSWYKEAFSFCDFFISISQSVSRELQTYMSDSGKDPAEKVFDYFYLGSDFTSTSEKTMGKALLRKDIKQVFSGCEDDIFLMVGTLEPRKNHEMVLTVFERLWNEGVRAKLCLAGKVGWKCESIVSGIRTSKFLEDRLFWFEDLHDVELAYAYSHSSALVFPSHAEGYGLPIVEALSKGIAVIASDIPVHREVGGEKCFYFDLQDDSTLEDTIRTFQKRDRTQATASLKRHTPLSWEDSACMLYSKVMNICGWSTTEAGQK